MKARAGGVAQPEFRMPIMIPGAILTSCGLLIYGWAAQARVQWIVVDLGGFLFSFGEQIAGQALTAYVIDSYPDHASSASAASQLLRSLTAFAFPLFAPTMYDKLGHGWGNSLLALIVVVVGIPAPLLISRYGARMRERARESY
jgi:MFS family permease